jgi:hypothetical protein
MKIFEAKTKALVTGQNFETFWCTTGGDGLWSRKQTSVKVIKLVYFATSTQLEVYFDKKTWNVEKDGLIYTDDVWEEHFNVHIQQLTHHSIKFEYTEQGSAWS